MDVSFSESGVRQANRPYLPFLPKGSYRILKEVLKFAQLFSRPGKKSGRDEVWKKCQKVWSFFLFFFFSNLQQVRYKFIFFFVFFFKSYSTSSVCFQRTTKKAWFLRFKVSVDHLFDNLETGERNYCFGKSSGKSLEF